MNSKLPPLLAAFRLNTRLFLNCLDGLSDELARSRPAAGCNSLAYIALHLHDARHYLAEYLGTTVADPFGPITAEARSIDDISVYPSLAEARTAWLEITEALERRFRELSDEELERPSPPQAPDFPVDDKTTLGGVAFLLQHESYHLGQLALLRRILGLEAMSWQVRS